MLLVKNIKLRTQHWFMSETKHGITLSYHAHSLQIIASVVQSLIYPKNLVTYKSAMQCQLAHVVSFETVMVSFEQWWKKDLYVIPTKIPIF